MANEVAKQPALAPKAFLEQPNIKARFEEMLGKRSSQFLASVLQIVAQNELLKNADPFSIYSAAIMAATLDLPLNQNFGYAYIIPYNAKRPDGTYGQVAQFQIGYKGLIQLAQRSRLYKNISATRVYEGQLVSEDPLRGNTYDWKQKKSDKIVGYVSYFRLVDGFEKDFYMTVEELAAHGAKYSKTYKNANSKWKEDADAMCLKTVLKLNISKFGPLSVEMQKAVTSDQAVIKDPDTMDVEYVDNIPDIQMNKEWERDILLIENASTIKELETYFADGLPEPIQVAYDKKWEELNAAGK